MLSLISTARRFAPRGRTIPLFSLLSLAKSRQDLASLDRHLLQDVGLTETDAKTEAAKPVWDVPATWRL